MYPFGCLCAVIDPSDRPCIVCCAWSEQSARRKAAAEAPFPRGVTSPGSSVRVDFVFTPLGHSRSPGSGVCSWCDAPMKSWVGGVQVCELRSRQSLNRSVALAVRTPIEPADGGDSNGPGDPAVSDDFAELRAKLRFMAASAAQGRVVDAAADAIDVLLERAATARQDGIEEAVAVIEGGSFHSDVEPRALFAKEVVKAIRRVTRTVRPPASAGRVLNPDALHSGVDLAGSAVASSPLAVDVPLAPPKAEPVPAEVSAQIADMARYTPPRGAGRRWKVKIAGEIREGGVGGAFAFSKELVTGGPAGMLPERDPNIPALTFWYRNHRDELALRTVYPIGPVSGNDEWHPEIGWSLLADDIDKGARRNFRFDHMIGTAPIPMILHCPACHLQHVDAPTETWPNEPHRSHLCHGCGFVWRPADVFTTGVVAIQTQGTRDSCSMPSGPLDENPELLELAGEALERMRDRGTDGLTDRHPDGSAVKVLPTVHSRAGDFRPPRSPSVPVEQIDGLRSLLEAMTGRNYAGTGVWSWERHGDGWALYIGRGEGHGLNVLSASNADAFDHKGSQLRTLIATLLNTAPVLLDAAERGAS